MFERLCEWKIWMRNTHINRWVPRLAFQANNPQGEQSESTHDIQTSGQTKLKEFWHDPLISNKLVSMTEVIEFCNTVLRWCCTCVASEPDIPATRHFLSCPIDAVFDYSCLVQVQTMPFCVLGLCKCQACALRCGWGLLE